MTNPGRAAPSGASSAGGSGSSWSSGARSGSSSGSLATSTCFTVDGNGHPSDEAQLGRTSLDELAIWWHTLRLVRNGLRRCAARPPGGWEAGSRSAIRDRSTSAWTSFAPDLAPIYDPHAAAGLRPEVPAHAVALPEHGSGMQDQFEATGKTLVQFNEQVQKAGVEFLLVIVPTEVQSNPARRADVHMQRKRGRTDHPAARSTNTRRRGALLRTQSRGT